MQDSILGIVVLVIGLFLFFLAVFLMITFSSQGQLADNAMSLFILLIIALICIIYGGKETIS